MHVRDKLIEADPSTGAAYFVLSDSEIARTVHVFDLVMVDVDTNGRPVGIKFAIPLPRVTQDEWCALFNAFPELKELFPNFL